MALSPDQLRYCIGVTNDISARYAEQFPNSFNGDRDVDLLVWMCSVYVEKYIRTYESEDSDQTMDKMEVWACTVVTDTGYDIVVVRELEEPWRRFVVAKEAFQVVFDRTDVRNMDLMKHVVEMANIASFPAAATTMSPAAAVELMAEVAAMEFLFPYANRLEESENGEKDWSAIARKYGVPQHYVELYLSTSSMDELRPYSSK